MTSSEKALAHHERSAPENSEDALALEFALSHSDELRYVSQWGRWLLWDGRRWKFETTLKALDLARAICRSTAARAKAGTSGSLPTRLASAQTVAAVERLAKADRRLALSTEVWDAATNLLNTPSGTIDLTAGLRRDHCREDYLTQLTAVGPSDDPCPVWVAFLERVTAGDRELRRFLQVMCGYCLTGETSEHALFFLYGTGANGKSVFLNTISGIFGDYSKTAAMETFIASTTDRHPTDLAGLRGSRLVTASETEEGRKWAESKIKSLTGGDKISARFMRQDFFEFIPQFKLVIAGNHRPSIRGVDEAMRRRMNLIPFTVTIPKAERDPQLAEKLRAEWPAILGWMLEGCRIWRAEGLRQPTAVTAATAEYLESEDAVSQWLADRCELNAGGYEKVSDLFADWKTWADRAGEFVGSEKRLSRALADRGLVRIKETGTGRAAFQRVRLRPRGHEGYEG